MAEAIPLWINGGNCSDCFIRMGKNNGGQPGFIGLFAGSSNSVRCTAMKYPDLSALLRGEPEARQFFNQLPDYVQSQIMTRSNGVNSLSSLKDYAENLTRGDG